MDSSSNVVIFHKVGIGHTLSQHVSFVDNSVSDLPIAIVQMQ